MTGGWVVVCEDYTAGPWSTAEIAGRQLAQIVDFGKCSGDHAVEEA